MSILRKNHSGQVALIMVLIMTVIGAVAVSMASRTTTETRSQEMTTESLDALLAAQAGLEQAAYSQTAVSGSLADGKNYTVSVVSEGTTGVISDKINPGETVDVNLNGAETLTGANVYWRPASPSAYTAIFISDVRSDKTYDFAYDNLGINGFTKVVSGGNLNGVGFTYVTPTTIAISSASSKTLRITVLGGAAFVGVQPVGGLFPPQTLNYKAIGNVSTGDSTTKYGLEYKESTTPQLPTVFGYALFANGSIIQ